MTLFIISHSWKVLLLHLMKISQNIFALFFLTRFFSMCKIFKNILMHFWRFWFNSFFPSNLIWLQAKNKSIKNFFLKFFSFEKNWLRVSGQADRNLLKWNKNKTKSNKWATFRGSEENKLNLFRPRLKEKHFSSDKKIPIVVDSEKFWIPGHQRFKLPFIKASAFLAW